MSGEPVLSAIDVATWFHSDRGVVRAVDGVSLELRAGRMLGLVGESGSGKTVFARSLLGLTPKRSVAHSRGAVLLDGRDLRALDERALQSVRGREIAMVFQDPMTALNPVRKIGRQIADPLRHHFGMSAAAARSTAISLLDRVGIPSPAQRVDEYPVQLSGGMRQRVVIAIALSCQPRVLIADEPTTALDVTVQAQILELLHELMQERQMSVLLVTHDMGVVAEYADEVAVMYAGRVVEQGSTTSLFSDVRMRYTEALLGAIPQADDDHATPLVAIEGRPPDLADQLPGCSFAPRCGHADDRCRSERPSLLDAGGTTDRVPHRCACWNPVRPTAQSAS